MLHTLINALHVGPLFVIALLMVLPRVMSLFGKAPRSSSFTLPALLVLCSVGIVSGSFVHHHEIIELFDPCVGYGITLVAIAVRVARMQQRVANVG